MSRDVKYHHMMPVWSMTTGRKIEVGVTCGQWNRLRKAKGRSEEDAIYREIFAAADRIGALLASKQEMEAVQ